MVIDLHNMTCNDAIRFFITKYNELYKNGYRGSIEVIHGYGSHGEGGVIKKRLRKFLLENKSSLKFTINANPGVTFVVPVKAIPQMKNEISKDILEFCRENPKSLDKIKGNFFKKYTNREILATVKSLVKKGELESFFKKNHEVYLAK
ncbi:Smr/MutS family protein [Ilyobacter polytropus]|uniref:Smr protein/MutS2 n=1 Tax=Ilyobacter polytropus (strain ATCC 51220 / DSM 2926 / LMG 16218 / CuHBu1) TaxID=572544 RepID=E3HAB6_ILYPC|nr:Smr/MutS family protein [Ilyobacter polytropus]ADO83646.1 Smr protein/MutS2 [Ilyobacter polytropus DSM 2926]